VRSQRGTDIQNIVEMALLFLAFYLPGFLGFEPALGQEAGQFARVVGQYLLAAIPQVLLLLYILWLRERQEAPGVRAGFQAFGIVRPRGMDLLYALAIFVGLMALLLALNLLLSLLPEGGRALFRQGFRWRLTRPLLVPLALVFGLVTGYREELFFRCYLLTRLGQLSLPPAAAVALSTLVFAGGHLYQGAAGFLVAAVQGAYFAVLFQRMRNLHRLALAHALYNGLVLVASLFAADPLPVHTSVLSL
jgi:membrane protease YdiL (CAAX protease family)